MTGIQSAGSARRPDVGSGVMLRIAAETAPGGLPRGARAGRFKRNLLIGWAFGVLPDGWRPSNECRAPLN